MKKKTLFSFSIQSENKYCTLSTLTDLNIAMKSFGFGPILRKVNVV